MTEVPTRLPERFIMEYRFGEDARRKIILCRAVEERVSVAMALYLCELFETGASIDTARKTLADTLRHIDRVGRMEATNGLTQE